MRQPLWVAFKPAFGIVLLLGVVSPLVRATDGAARLLVVVVALISCVGLVTAVARWDRQHRLPRH